ncbi:hypothetical protein GCM10009830_39800 [Glycomyces endophyticus]|uniref:Hsp70 family protein n=1 Tax=Glycomyces endophyticus TaxID=480996 RepID=A0ABN2HI13_9ACTN
MTPPHLLGVDFGTSHVVAALRTPDGRTRPLLFDGSPLLPSGVFLDVAGETHLGRDALRLAVGAPDRFEPNPKRHVAEPSILLGDSEIEMSAVLTAVFAKVLRACTEETPVPPPIVLTHPSTWGAVKTGLLRDAALAAGFPSAATVSEPVAAAAYYERALGHTIDGALAVVDLGGGTVDIAVLARDGDGPPAVVAEGGLSGFGGIDIDAAVVEHLRAAAPETEAGFWAGVVDPKTDRQRRERNQVWTEAREAKEMLSRATTAPLALPGRDTTAHLTRAELEAVAEPLLAPVAAELDRVRERAESGGHDLTAIFMVGGAARMPLAGSVVHRATGIAPVLIERPELVVADGAAGFAGPAAPADTPTAPAEPAPGPYTPPAVPATPPSTVHTAPVLPARPTRPRRRLAVAAAAAAAIALLASVLFLNPGDLLFPDRAPVSGALVTTAGTVCDGAVPAFPEGATGFLRGPHFELRPSCAGVLTPAEAAGLAWLIEDLPELAPGQRLALVHFEAAEQVLSLPDGSVHEVATEIVLGDRSWNVTGVPGEDTLYYAVIPAGDRTAVTVTDAERAQTLDLASGEVETPVLAYYHGALDERQLLVKWKVGLESDDQEWTGGSLSMEDPVQVSRQAFDETAGWLTEPGMVRLTAVFSYIHDYTNNDMRFEFDALEQFWVNTRNGPLAAVGVEAVDHFIENDDPGSEGEGRTYTMVFEVPADMTSVEFAFAPPDAVLDYSIDVWLYPVDGEEVYYYTLDFAA